MKTLVQGFKGSMLFGIVSVAAFTGARQNEILALRWSDLDSQKKTLRIERALEVTKAHGVRFKGPKSDKHKRTIIIDDDLLTLLLAERTSTCASLLVYRMAQRLICRWSGCLKPL